MSTQSPIYILWGLMLPYPKDSDAVYESGEDYMDSAFDTEPKPGVTILLDGMGGKYLAIGHVLARSGPYGDDLGTHTIPTLYPSFDPFQDPDTVKKFSDWRNEIEAALKVVGLQTASLGLSYGWHVIQHYR
jgi:hypothetical protein